MRKKVLSIVLLSALATTATFAYGPKDDKGNCQNMKEQCMKMEKKDGFKKEHRGEFSFMRYLHKLDLSDSQRAEIRKFMEDNRPKKMAMSEAFKDGKFDKDKYVQLNLNKQKNMLEYKASMIEKIYSVLTKEQKAELSKDLSDFENGNFKGRMNDKYSDGRG